MRKTFCLIGALTLLTVLNSNAVISEWNVNASGKWSTSGNWSAGIPTSAGDTANLTFDIIAARTVTIDTVSRTVGTLNLGDTAVSYEAYTLAASGGANLVFNNNGGGALLAKTDMNNNVIDLISTPVVLSDNLTISNADSTLGSGLTVAGIIGESGGSRSITNNGAGIVRFDGANTYSGGTTLNTGELQVGTASTYSGIVGSFGTGTLIINGGTFSSRNGNKTLTNSVMVCGDFTLNGANAGGNWLTFSGAVDLDGGERTITVGATPNGAIISGPISNGGLTKAGAGPLTLSAINTYSGPTTVSAGTLFVNGSVGNSAVTVASGGTLSGVGSIGGIVAVNPGGTLEAGTDTIGTLTLSNSLFLGGTVTAKIDRNGGSPLADRIVAGDNAINYGGTLVVDNIGALLQAGDKFTLFTAGSHNGTFRSIVGPPGAGLNYSFINGILSVATSAATNPTNITASISSNLLTLSWPADHIGWRLQAQTNSLTTGISTNWFDVPGSMTTDNFTVPVDSHQACVLYRQTWAPQSVISYVDRSLNPGQKYLLRVDGKPFYMTSIQVRLDKLRYGLGWDAAAREAIIAQAASDGFNTVSILIHWYEVEPTKDRFDWTILDEYLGLVNKYNLKMELLWLGQNSGGYVQWLGRPANPVHLRTPNYVLYSPAYGSTNTTSEYTIRRDMTDYTLDLADNNLKARETYVLGRVMAHIAAWDGANGLKHPVIGVQLGNEVKGYGVQFPSSLVLSYYNSLASAIKNSAYVVWTRMNCISSFANDRIAVNEALRSGSGTLVDFIGTDLYRIDASTVQATLPYSGGNYRMIMECGAETNVAPIFQLAALSGNNAFDYYDMCGTDGHELYDRTNNTEFTPHGNYITDVRTINKLLDSDIVDIALNAQGYGLFVHNWAGDSIAPTTNNELGIVFTPSSTTSQGISINRSNTEIVLMNTEGGAFTYPSSLGITGASQGFFDNDNNWVSQGSVPFTSTSISPESGTTVRLSRTDTGKVAPSITLQAELANYGGGAIIKSSFLGFAGNGYMNFTANGAYVQWDNVNGLSGGNRTIRFRFANGDATLRTADLTVNGTSRNITFPPTGSWDNYQFLSLTVPLNSGTNNTIRLEATGQDSGNIDEMQIF